MMMSSNGAMFDSACAAAFQTFDGVELYPSIAVENIPRSMASGCDRILVVVSSDWWYNHHDAMCSAAKQIP